MALGIGGFKPAVGDLVKVISDSYPAIRRGTISRIAGMSNSKDYCFIEENVEVPVNTRDLELVAYRIGRCEFASRTRKVRSATPMADEVTNDKGHHLERG